MQQPYPAAYDAVALLHAEDPELLKQMEDDHRELDAAPVAAVVEVAGAAESAAADSQMSDIRQRLARLQQRA